jgi:DNA-binding MarR family transcriptional regulator
MRENINEEIGEIFFQIHRLRHIRFSEIIKVLGVSPRQIPILKHLYKNGSLNQRQLAEKIRVSPASIALMLKKMQTNGLIDKTPDLTDRRFFSVSLTEKGKKIIERFGKIRKNIDMISVEGLSNGEKQQLHLLLSSVLENLQNTGKEE